MPVYYLEARTPEGETVRFEYSTTKAVRCPFDAPRDTGAERRYAPDALKAAAEAVGIDADVLLASAHRGGSRGFEGGRCLACGAKAEAVGYWARRVVVRPGALGIGEVVERHVFPLRREAKAWAVEQAGVARSVEREAKAGRS